MDDSAGKMPAGYWAAIVFLATSLAYNFWIVGGSIYRAPTHYFIAEAYIGAKLFAVALLLCKRAESVYLLMLALPIGLLYALLYFIRSGFWIALSKIEGREWLAEVVMLCAIIVYARYLARRGKLGRHSKEPFGFKGHSSP